MAASSTEAVAGGLRVTVVYAQADRQWNVSLVLAPGATVADAIAASGLAARLGPPGGAAPDAGIFHRRCPPDTVLRDGDRVEIYRPLQIDPKEARHQRVARKRRMDAAARSGAPAQSRRTR